MTDYSGPNRRESDRSHDTLIRIDENLSNFMKRFDEHVERDEKHFERIYPAISDLKAFMWKLTGAGIALGIVFSVVKFIVPIINK